MYPDFAAFMFSTSAKVLQSLRYAGFKSKQIPHTFFFTTTAIIYVFVVMSTPRSFEFTVIYEHFTAFMLSTSAKVIQSLRNARHDMID